MFRKCSGSSRAGRKPRAGKPSGRPKQLASNCAIGHPEGEYKAPSKGPTNGENTANARTTLGVTVTTEQTAIDSFTEIEQEIIAAACAGHLADFTDKAVDGEKPKVSAAFLSDLWLDRIPDVSMHPIGILIKGLSIEGEWALGGARQTESGRDCLLGFSFEDCDFEKVVDFDNIRCETLSFNKCTFSGLSPAGNGMAADFHGAQISGSIFFVDCRFEGYCRLHNAEISGQVGVGSVVFKHGADFSDVRIGGSIRLFSCKFGENAGAVSCDLTNIKIGGWCAIFACRFADGFSARNAEIVEMFVKKTKFGSNRWVAFTLAHTIIKGRLSFATNRFHGVCFFTKAEIGSTFDVSRCIFGSGFIADGLCVDGHFEVVQTRMSTKASADYSLYLERARLDRLSLRRCTLNGHVSLSAAEIRAQANLHDCVIGARRRQLSPPEFVVGFEAMNLKVGLTLNFNQCSIYARCVMPRMRIDNGLQIFSCYFGHAPGRWSIDLHGVEAANIVSIKRCCITSGISMPLLQCAELQVEGCLIGPGGDGIGRGTYAIWASDGRIARRIFIGGYREGEMLFPNCITGIVDFSSSQVEESIRICSTQVGLAEGTKALGIDLSSVKVAGNVELAPHGNFRLDAADKREEPATIEGCVKLDDARIEGDLLLHETRIEATGEIIPPTGRFESEERVSRRKRGVALSLRDARVEGELEIGTPSLTGIVDLRDSAVGLINDGGGDRWERAGLAPGHLLLHGLTYRALDNVYDEQDHDASKRSSVATRRLRWLQLQFPDRQATPETFVPQPYEQLARIFSAEGNERARRRVLVMRRDLQRRHGSLSPFERAIGWLLKVVSDYGYSPGRAIAVMLVYFALGAVAAAQLRSEGAIVLANLDSNPDLIFNAIFFAIDSAVPIIDLGQDSVWAIRPDDGVPWLARDAIMIAKGLYEIVGMMLLSVTILTLTGTLRDSP